MRKTYRIKNMRKVIILSASFFLLLFACKKDENKIIPGYVKDIAEAEFTNQIKIETKTIKGDSVLADNVAIGLVGQYKDSVFGTSIASMYFQPLLPSSHLTLGEANQTLVVDSVILSLVYEGGFGDSTSQEFEVYEITEKLDQGTPYPSNVSVSTSSTILGSKIFEPKFNEKVKVLEPNAIGRIDTISLNPQLRIKLDDELGDRILSKSGQSELENSDNFTAFFYGLKVAPKQGAVLSDNEDAILYFALTSSTTRINLYYSAVDANGDTTKRVEYFPVGTKSVRFNTFEHDYTSTVVETSINTPESDSIYTYVQAMAGVQTELSFPDINDQFKKGEIVVHKAELVLPVENGSYSKYGVSKSLILASKNESGALTFIPDYFEGEAYFGGKYDEDKEEYVFNISRYIQDIINEQTNSSGLTIMPTGSAINASRVVLQGPANSNKQIKLNLFYSKVK